MIQYLFIFLQVSVEVDQTVYIGGWASKKRDAEKLAAAEALNSIRKPPETPNEIVPVKKPFDQCLLMQNMAIEDDDNQMDCD